MFENKDDTILARWLAGELTSEELQEFKATDEYAQYESIVQGLDRLEKPSFDGKSLKKRIQNTIDTPPRQKVFSIKTVTSISAIAASMLLIVGLFFNKVTYTTGIGETHTITLSDGTKVIMNSGSTVHHKRFFWSSQREVYLEGEAFFDVTSGDDFVVNTKYGEIAVLGTEFNIHTREKSFELACYEGKVRYTNSNTQETAQLTRGKAIQVESDKISQKEAGESPAWMSGKSQFESTPLSEVLEDLQLHYKITVIPDEIDMEQSFTGNFRYDDLDLALRKICLAMGLEYTLSDNKQTVTITKR